MNLLINMPSMRWWNWPLLYLNYMDARASAPTVNLTWAIIVYPDELSMFPEFVKSIRNIDWIKIVVIQPDPQRYIVTHKINEGLKQLLPGYDGYVWQGSDDNLVPRSFLKWFAQAALSKKKVLVCSHKRGSGAGRTGHGTSDLVAHTDHVMVGSISGEQFFIHSDLHKTDGKVTRFYVEGGCCDGVMVTELHNEMPDEFFYDPTFFIPFNAQEEGRWTPKELKSVLDV